MPPDSGLATTTVNVKDKMQVRNFMMIVSCSLVSILDKTDLLEFLLKPGLETEIRLEVSFLIAMNLPI